MEGWQHIPCLSANANGLEKGKECRIYNAVDSSHSLWSFIWRCLNVARQSGEAL